jgi:hypothetical protein
MKCIYTVIVDGYDTLKEPLHPNPDWDFVCFTDNPSLLKTDRWRVVLLNNPHGLSNHLLSRRPKILTHEYLPEYDLTLYVDATYRITGDLNQFIESPIEDISLVIRDLNRSIGDEIKDLIKYKTIAPNEADLLVKTLSKEGYNSPRGTYYFGGLILRKQTEQIKKLMEEWWQSLTLFKRDQPYLQFLLWKYKIKPGEYSTRQVRQYLSYHFHTNILTPDDRHNPSIFYFTPADPNKKIGKVYNAHCESVPNNEDWICIRDGDTMFLTSNWSEIITEAVKRYPDTSLFGCYTNRIGLDYQLTEHGFSENPDIKHHAKIARERWEKYGSECVEINKPVAGMFMLFKRSVWTRVPFKDELVINNKFFDWDFGERVIKLGGTVRLIKGLYLMHYYRFDKGRQDKSHLING